MLHCCVLSINDDDDDVFGFVVDLDPSYLGISLALSLVAEILEGILCCVRLSVASRRQSDQPGDGRQKSDA